MRRSNSGFFGTVLVVFGLVYLLANLGVVDADWFTDNLWPLGLILAGIWLVFVRSRRSSTDHERGGGGDESERSRPSTDSRDRLDISEAFGSIRREVTSKTFAGGRCVVVFGVVDLDMAQIELLSNAQTLRLSCVFGKMNIKIPRDLEYSIRANLVAAGMNVRGERLGGVLQNVAVRSGGASVAEKRLAITASCTFGEIEIT